MKKINGKKIASEIIESLKSKPVPKKIFAAVLVGDNPANASFLKQKEKAAKELGLDFRIYEFPENSETEQLKKEISKISGLKNVGAVLVQLPLPAHIDARLVLSAIPKEKDVDVLGESALGAFYNEKNKVLPPAVLAVKKILESENFNIEAGKAAVVGLGFLVGRPVAVWLMKKTKGLYLLDKGSDFGILKEADLVVSAAGHAGLIKNKDLKKGASVIDFGFSLKGGAITGDFDVSGAEGLNFYTPMPGGTGPILVAGLLKNFYDLNDGE